MPNDHIIKLKYYVAVIKNRQSWDRKVCHSKTLIGGNLDNEFSQFWVCSLFQSSWGRIIPTGIFSLLSLIFSLLQILPKKKTEKIVIISALAAKIGQILSSPWVKRHFIILNST